MYHIYSLKKRLEQNPEIVEQAKKMTLNEKRPLLGFKGTYGFYGSEEWWNNMDNKVIPQKVIKGEIVKIYVTGWGESKNNTIDILLDDGSIIMEGMYANNNDYKSMYKVGKRIKIEYFTEEQKKKDENGNHIQYDHISNVFIEQ